jgi:hypothetical protein
VFLVNSRLGLYSATRQRFSRLDRHVNGHPFSRSYGVNLPSSLTRVLSIALVSSTYLPVSVCGTDTRVSSLSGFSRQCGSNDSSDLTIALVLASPYANQTDFPPGSGFTRTRAMSIRPAPICPPASPHRSSRVVTEYKPFVHRLRVLASA